MSLVRIVLDIVFSFLWCSFKKVFILYFGIAFDIVG